MKRAGGVNRFLSPPPPYRCREGLISDGVSEWRNIKAYTTNENPLRQGEEFVRDSPQPELNVMFPLDAHKLKYIELKIIIFFSL